jgi:hypothetical protein
MRSIDFAHSADRDEGFNLVLSDALAGRKRTGLVLHQVGSEMNGRRDKERLVVRFEERFDLCPDGGTGGCKQGLPLVRGKVNRLVKQMFDFFPTSLWIHDPSPLISRISHVRASRQSRFTVITDIPRASAVSSMLKPPK